MRYLAGRPRSVVLGWQYIGNPVARDALTLKTLKEAVKF